VAQRNPTITFENIPLEQARRMTRGPRIGPELSHALSEKSFHSGQLRRR
jgi:hypothetical protein